jgi:hypothetical protein
MQDERNGAAAASNATLMATYRGEFSDWLLAAND